MVARRRWKEKKGSGRNGGNLVAKTKIWFAKKERELKYGKMRRRRKG